MNKLFLIGIVVFFSSGMILSNPDDTVSVEIKMDDHSFNPSMVEIPAEKVIKLNFTNIGSTKHEFVAGQSITDYKDGYKKNLFEDVGVKKLINGKVIEEENSEHDIEIKLGPDESGSLIFKLPESKKGEWDMGCFINLGGGTHYEMGMKGKIIVK